MAKLVLFRRSQRLVVVIMVTEASDVVYEEEGINETLGLQGGYVARQIHLCHGSITSNGAMMMNMPRPHSEAGLGKLG